MRQTYFAKASDVTQNWRLIDAEDQVLGRLASRIAVILMGKDKPEYTPHVDTGDFVVVVNAGKVRMTGRKLDTKFQKRYSGYPGGLHTTSYRELREKRPERLIRLAVRRMLPKTNLGRQMLRKLKVYADAEHPHAAQQPQAMAL